MDSIVLCIVLLVIFLIRTVEIFKSLDRLNPKFIQEMFQRKETSYDLRSTHILILLQTKHYRHGVLGMLFRTVLLWNHGTTNILHNNSIYLYFQSLLLRFEHVLLLYATTLVGEMRLSYSFIQELVIHCSSIQSGILFLSTSFPH